MSAETFNACLYLVARQVEAGHGDHLAVTGPAGERGHLLVRRDSIAQRLGKPGD